MFSNSKISGVSSKLASVAKFARSRTVLAAAIAATSLGLAGTSFGAFSNVTSITTSNTVGTPTTVTGVNGAGSSYSIYNNSSYTYTMSYKGDDDAITSLTAGGQTYNVMPSLGSVTAQSATSSNASTNNLVIWEMGTGTGANHSTVTLDGPAVSNFSQAFNSNNVLIGADNVFSNMGNAVGNNTNVRRIDVLFTSAITTSSNTAFSVFDRGPSNDHDSFYIAAITAESGGLPTAYGPLIPVADGTWGTTSITPPGMTDEQILRKDLSSSSNPFQPSDYTDQTVGGVLIATNQLGVATGANIYGYSLFAGDSAIANDSGAQLVNYESLPAADSTSTGGGLDPLATLGNLYTLQSSVPEPTTGALALLGISGLLSRRSKRKAAELI